MGRGKFILQRFLPFLLIVIHLDASSIYPLLSLWVDEDCLCPDFTQAPLESPTLSSALTHRNPDPRISAPSHPYNLTKFLKPHPSYLIWSAFCWVLLGFVLGLNSSAKICLTLMFPLTFSVCWPPTLMLIYKILFALVLELHVWQSHSFSCALSKFGLTIWGVIFRSKRSPIIIDCKCFLAPYIVLGLNSLLSKDLRDCLFSLLSPLYSHIG